MTHRLNRWLLALMVAFAVPFWWLMMDNSPGAAPAKPIHIAELRQLAATLPGPRPIAPRFTIVATRLIPGDLYAAGIGLKRRPLALVSWSLPVPGARPILIDAETNASDARAKSFRNFDSFKQHRIDSEAASAGMILSTHQMPASSQSHPTANRPLGKTGLARPVVHPVPPAASPIADTSAPMAIAPGVVVIPAPDYAPGAQLIYVQFADGREFLFAGDISALDDNWAQLRARSLLAAHWLAPQRRATTYPWLRTIRQLHQEAPKLIVVPGSDYVWLTNARRNGTVVEENSSPPIAGAPEEMP